MRTLARYLLCLAVCCAFAPPQGIKQFVIDGIAQGTTYHISYYDSHERITKGQVDSVLAVIDNSMSIYKPSSLISKINRSEDGGMVDQHFKTVLEKSFEVYRETRGKFDLTVGPLVAAWGFSNRRVSALPDSAKIDSLLPCVGMGKLRLEGNRLYKAMPCVEVDVNGIAQGYSVDVLADFFLVKGIVNFIVEVGGELRVSGKKPGGDAFKVGLEGPGKSPHEPPSIKHVVALRKGALTTSGNYRKFVEQGGKSYGHLIDPSTGYPFKTAMLSVTVYAPDAITADGYDNALMAMDIEEALLFIRKHRKMEAYFIYQNKEGMVVDTMSNGFRKLISDNKNNE